VSASNDGKYLLPPDDFPKEGSAASGSDTAYTVEVRLAYYVPQIRVGRLLDTRWQTIDFETARTGVPIARGIFPTYDTLGLLSYQAAQALRWWFIAEAAKNYEHLCLETRLVEHKVAYSYKASAVRACAYVGGGEDRSNMFPEVAVTAGNTTTSKED
jgi:hypothetical protein